MRKKALSWILTVAMTLSLFTAIPITANAAGNSCKIVETAVEYATLDEALLAATSGQTIQLLTDISYGSTIAADNKSFTLDVNGHSLSVNLASADIRTCIYAANGYDLHVTDSAGDGSVSLSASVSEDMYGLYAYNGSTINIDVPTSININANNSYGIFAMYGGEINVTGNINVTGTNSYGAFADGTAVGSLITIDGEINTANYVHVHLDSFSGPEQSISPTTKEGYYTFFDTDDTANPKSTVWVKAAAAPGLYGYSVWRSNASTATVRFMSSVAGTYYYKITDDDTVPSNTDLSGWTTGAAVSADTTVSFSPAGLTAGEKYLYLAVMDAENTISEVLTISMPHDCYYFENFEAYPLDTTIASHNLSPIEQINSGTGDANQKVTTAVGNDSAKMLTLSSASSWASDQAMILKDGAVSVFAAGDNYTFEGDVYALGTTSWQLRFSVTTGTYSSSTEAGVFFKNGKIVSISDSERELMGYTANQWYHVKIEAYPSAGTYAVYVGGTLLDDTLTLPSGINRLAITAGHGFTTYYDNLEFHTAPEPVVCKILNTNYVSITTALEAVTTGQTIVLLDDITYNDRIWAGSSYYPSLNLDLNGYDLEISNVEVPIAALDGCYVNVTDSSLSGGSKLILNTTTDDSAPTGIAAHGADCLVSVDEKVTTTITAKGSGSKGVSARDGGVVEIGAGSITSDTCGISAYGKAGETASSVVFTGNVTALSDYGIGVLAEDGGYAEVSGDITGPNIGHGAIAYSGTIEITGDITSMGNAATANGSGVVTVTGNAEAIGDYGDGAYAYGGGTVSITGNVTSSANGYCGAHAASGGSITVDGNVSETGSGGIGAYSYGYTGLSGTSGEITIMGSITAENYILLETENGSLYKEQADSTEPTTKTGYYTYSDDYNTVWVKIHTPPYATAVSIDGTLDPGETLTGNYTFNSDDSLTESGTTFRWLRVSATPSLLGEPYLLFTTNNVGGVSSSAGGPPNPCIFTVTDTTVINKISNYHYGSGDAPGTISLRKSDGTVYGPWDAVLDGYWRGYPDVTIPAGTYTVIDSKPESWSYDYESNYTGMTEIVGYTIITGATDENYTLQDSDSGKSIMFEVTPGDSSGNTGAAVKSNPFGPVSLLTENQLPVLTTDWNYSTVNFGQDYPFTLTVTDFENSPNARLYSYIDTAAPSQAYNYAVVPGIVNITLWPSEGVISAGNHTLNYYVTDANGATSEVLVLPFTILDNDATLSALSASGITLNPAYESETTEYTADVSNNISSTTISATASDGAAVVKINGEETVLVKHFCNTTV